MPNLPHASWLRSFEAAARLGSFSSAASELGLTPAAVSQQIRLLESHLGATLFNRLARGVALTDLGQAYAQTIRKAFGEMQVATDTLFSRPAQRSVHVRAPISCAMLIIAPKLPAFRAAHPDITVSLTTFVWADRFASDGSDIDIRYGHGDWTDGDVLHLGHEHVVPVCHPQHLENLGPKASIHDLTQAGVVQIIGYEAEWQNLSDHHSLDLAAPKVLAKVDSSLLALQTVHAGYGATLVLERFLTSAPPTSGLRQAFDYRAPVQHAHYIVRRNGTALNADVMLVTDWLQRVFR